MEWFITQSRGQLDDLTALCRREPEDLPVGVHGLHAEKLAGVPKLDRALWHSYRRKFATERKHLPDVDAAAAGGWRSARTLVEIYQRPDADSMLRVVLDGGQPPEAE